jgi:hypothetical protein
LINSTGQVVFLADLPDIGAVALFSWTRDGGLVPVVSTNDTLPDGANLLLRPGPPSTSDSEALVRSLWAGGKTAFYAVDITSGSGAYRQIASEGDTVPGAGVLFNPAVLSMNAKGEAVMLAQQLLDPTTYPRSGVLASRPGSGPQKVLVTGDDLPGGTHAGLAFGQPRINNQSQVAILARNDSTGTPGIYLMSLDAPSPAPVVRFGDPWPGSSTATFGGINGNIAFNDKGSVAFMANSPSPSAQGLFVGSADGPPRKLAQTGDPAPIGTVNQFLAPFKINAAGQVAFVANYGGSAGSGSAVILGSASQPVRTVATTGSVAPGTGNQKFAQFNPVALDLNGSGQVAFLSYLCCSETFAGWFLGTADAPPVPKLVVGQDLPGGGHAGNLSAVNRIGVLADSGELAVLADGNGDSSRPQIVVSGKDGTLRKVAVDADPAPGTDAQFGKIFPFLTATPSGRFVFTSMLANGSPKAGLFISVP